MLDDNGKIFKELLAEVKKVQLQEDEKRSTSGAISRAVRRADGEDNMFSRAGKSLHRTGEDIKSWSAKKVNVLKKGTYEDGDGTPRDHYYSVTQGSVLAAAAALAGGAALSYWMHKRSKKVGADKARKELESARKALPKMPDNIKSKVRKHAAAMKNKVKSGNVRKEDLDLIERDLLVETASFFIEQGKSDELKRLRIRYSRKGYFYWC